MCFKVFILLFLINFIFSSVLMPSQNITIEVCNKLSCPETRGVCTKNGICTCFKPFKTIGKQEYGEFECNYEQKSQMIAFLLEFIISFGVGHMYLGNTYIAIGKMIFCFFAGYFLCFYPHFSTSVKSFNLISMIPYFQTLFVISFCIFQIVDAILFGTGYYKDANGVEMMKW